MIISAGMSIPLRSMSRVMPPALENSWGWLAAYWTSACLVTAQKGG